MTAAAVRAPQRLAAQLLAHTPPEVIPSRFCWAYLSRGEADELWVELVEWVDWLRHRYQLEDKKIPPCWFRHGAWIEELTALMEAWLAAHQRTPIEDQAPIAYAAAQPTSAAAYWHRTFFWPLIADANKIGPHDHDPKECGRGHIVDLYPDLPDWIAADIESRATPSVRDERAEAFLKASAAAAGTAAPTPSSSDGAGEPAAAEVIPSADMAAYLAEGAARVVHGADDQSVGMWPDAEYAGQVWTHDARSGSYRPRGEATDGGGERP